MIPIGRLAAALAACMGAFAATPPYPASEIVTGLTWDSGVQRLGTGVTGDNWPMTWGDDDALYTSYGDGAGFGNRDPKLTIGFARILDAPPDHKGVDLPGGGDVPVGWGSKGIKSSGLLMVNGVLYLFVRNYIVDRDFRHSRLAHSTDRGENWTWAGWHFSGSFGCPDFVQFGRNYAGARDDYVYVVSQAGADAYAFDRDIVMARVRKGKVPDRAAWEFFVGMDAKGEPAWTGDIAGRRPIFTDPNGAQRVSITYNKALQRYFLTTSHNVEGNKQAHTRALGVFEAPEPWGPWRAVYYQDDWSEHWTIHHKFPTKWMSADGKAMWLVFSGGNTPKAPYNCFMVRRATLTIGRRSR